MKITVLNAEPLSYIINQINTRKALFTGMKSYRTVKQRASAEFTEKKSVFIGCISPVSDEAAAKSFISEIKKCHPDATHNVFAYILEGTEIARFSDDGEPQGTAGMPVLEVLKREGLCGVAAVVTRYFGGTLLGAGGLVRAYAKAAKMAVDAAGICEFRPFTEFRLTVEYTYYEKIKKELEPRGIKLDGCDFGEKVVFDLAAETEAFDSFKDFVSDFTGASAFFEKTGERFDA